MPHILCCGLRKACLVAAALGGFEAHLAAAAALGTDLVAAGFGACLVAAASGACLVAASLHMAVTVQAGFVAAAL